jgi:hypothetical protein
VVATGSSDSHTIRSEAAGYPRTYVRPFLGGMTDAHAVLHALKAGRAFVTSGPFLSVMVDGKGPGEEVVIKNGKVNVDIRAQVPAWMELDKLRIYVGNQLVRSGALGAAAVRTNLASRYERTVALTLDALGPLVVAVDGEHTLDPIVARRGVPPLAFTNPIWLVATPTFVTPAPPQPPSAEPDPAENSPQSTAAEAPPAPAPVPAGDAAAAVPAGP